MSAIQSFDFKGNTVQALDEDEKGYTQIDTPCVARLIKDCYTELQRLADSIADRLGMPAYYSITPEMNEMCRISKLIGALKLYVETKGGNEIDGEDYEGEDDNN